jgi:hypothetical protein
MVGKVQRGIDLGDGGPHCGSQHGSPRWGVAAGHVGTGRLVVSVI